MMIKWIDVNEELPKTEMDELDDGTKFYVSEWVLISILNKDCSKRVDVAFYESYKEKGCWYSEEESFSADGGRVTHWMPFPDPPNYLED